MKSVTQVAINHIRNGEIEMNNVPPCQVMKLREVGMRARNEGISISDYAIRKAVHEGQLPCRIIGKTYLISWDQFFRWVTCSENSDTPLLTEEESHQPANPYNPYCNSGHYEPARTAPAGYRDFARLNGYPHSHGGK